MLGIDDRIVAAEFWRDPYPLFERLRREAPVWQLPGENAYLVATWPLVAEATRRVEDFSNHFRYTAYSHDDGTLGMLETGAIGPDVFAGADPPVHTEQRKIFFGDLVQRKIEAIEPFVTSLADHLLDELLGAGSPDAATGLSHQLPLRVVAERVIGFRDVDVDQLQRWMFDGSQMVGGLMTLDRMASFAVGAAGLVPWTDAQLDAAIASSTDGDVLSSTAAAVRSGVLTHEEASFTLMVLLGAGAETTTSLIGLAIELLARRPALQDELRREPIRVPAFVEEVLRYDAPFRYHPRTAARDTELDGVRIPEGALVLLLWASANRDETVFEHPDDFRLDRSNVHLHFGFGRGIHHCVGAALARLEARVVVTRLLARTRSFELDVDRPISWSPSIWIHRHDELPLVVDAA